MGVIMGVREEVAGLGLFAWGLGWERGGCRR